MFPCAVDLPAQSKPAGSQQRKRHDVVEFRLVAVPPDARSFRVFGDKRLDDDARIDGEKGGCPIT